MINVDLYTLWV